MQYGRKVDHKVYLNIVYGYYFYTSSYKYDDNAKLLGYLYINYQLDALIIILFIKYYSPLHVSSIKCSSSGGHSCIQAAYVTVTLYKSPGGLSIRS